MATNSGEDSCEGALSSQERRKYLLQIGGDLQRFEDLCVVRDRFSKASGLHSHSCMDLARSSGVDQDTSDDDDWNLLECSHGLLVDGAWDDVSTCSRDSDAWHTQTVAGSSASTAADQQPLAPWPLASGAASSEAPKCLGKAPTGKGDGCRISGSPHHWQQEYLLAHDAKDTGGFNHDHWSDDSWLSQESWEADADDPDAYWVRRKGKGKGKYRGYFARSHPSCTSIVPDDSMPSAAPAAPSSPPDSSPGALVFPSQNSPDPLARLRQLRSTSVSSGTPHFDVTEGEDDDGAGDPSDFDFPYVQHGDHSASGSASGPVVQPVSTRSAPRNVTGFAAPVNRIISMLTATMFSAMFGAVSTCTVYVPDTMFAIRGNPVHGLGIDGGVATVLSGTDTVRHCFW